MGHIFNILSQKLVLVLAWLGAASAPFVVRADLVATILYLSLLTALSLTVTILVRVKLGAGRR
jgi:hypothetical protein